MSIPITLLWKSPPPGESPGISVGKICECNRAILNTQTELQNINSTIDTEWYRLCSEAICAANLTTEKIIQK